MGSREQLCLLCGVCAVGGPHLLLPQHKLEEVTEQLATETKKGDLETQRIIAEALATMFFPTEMEVGFRHEWRPEGAGPVAGEVLHYYTDRCIAIGYFEPDDNLGAAPRRGDLIPDGTNVRIRQVGECAGGFFCTVMRARGWRDEPAEVRISDCSTTDGSNPNLAVCQRCYHYLKFWLDMSTLPASCNERSLSFAGELYEVVNSRTARRDILGLLPTLKYDGIEDTLGDWQCFFIHTRRGTKHLACAIEAGLRGSQLIPAILQDCRAWMFVRPDV
ncbi:hypothetical protein BDW22DRAFT_725295 [Trametopsis cervina]|nr:hypothetical protein BDW22DRAFT_725295 [Trametopsis cervina]